LESPRPGDAQPLESHSSSASGVTRPALINMAPRKFLSLEEPPYAQRLLLDSTSTPSRRHVQPSLPRVCLALFFSVLEVPVQSEGESRWAVIGTIDQKSWTAIITRRGTKIRIISVRRSRDEEEELYKKQEEINLDRAF